MCLRLLICSLVSLAVSTSAFAIDISGRYDTKLNCQYIGGDFTIDGVQQGGKFPDVLATDIWFIHEKDDGTLRMVEFFPDTDDFVIHYEGFIFDDVRNPGLRRVGFSSCGPSRELINGNQFIQTGIWDVRSKSGVPSMQGNELIYGSFFGQQYTSPCTDSMKRTSLLSDSVGAQAILSDILEKDCSDLTGDERYNDYFPD